MNSSRRDTVEFDAFLSHSSADARIVRRLHRQLERYRAPRGSNVKSRRIRVFHYETDSPLSPQLSRSLADRVSEIEQLVVAASPAAAQSPYVDLEIQSYLSSHRSHRVSVALVNGEKNNAFPRVLRESYPDCLYADLRGCNGNAVQWWLWQRKRMQHAILPLLASLFGVDRDELIQRDRRRRHSRVLGGVAVIGMIMVLLFFRYSHTPAQAWSKCPVLDDLPVSRVTLHRSGGGKDTVRTLSLWNKVNGDVPVNPNGSITEFSENGSRIASFRYWLDVEGEQDIHVRPGSVSGTTLNSSKYIAIMQKPPQLGIGDKGVECQVENGILTSVGEPLFRIDIADFKQQASEVGTAQGLGNPTVSSEPRFFELPDKWVLAASYLHVGRSFTGDGSGTLIQLTNDNGQTWRNAGIVEEFDVEQLIAISISDQSILHIGFQMVPEHPIPNALFRLRSSGQSWQRISLPPRVAKSSDWQLEDFAVSRDTERIVISAVEYGSDLSRRSLLLSRDQGRNWEDISANQPLARHAVLAGISECGTIVALFRRGSIRGDDYEDGEVHLWRDLSLYERIRRMWL